MDAYCQRIGLKTDTAKFHYLGRAISGKSRSVAISPDDAPNDLGMHDNDEIEAAVVSFTLAHAWGNPKLLRRVTQ